MIDDYSDLERCDRLRYLISELSRLETYLADLPYPRDRDREIYVLRDLLSRHMWGVLNSSEDFYSKTRGGDHD